MLFDMVDYYMMHQNYNRKDKSMMCHDQNQFPHHRLNEDKLILSLSTSMSSACTMWHCLA